MTLKILILSFILISSCIPKKTFLESEFSNIVYNCPNNGNCDLEILENKSLLLKVPSAVIQEEFNYLANPLHADFKKIKIIKTKSFWPDERLFKI